MTVPTLVMALRLRIRAAVLAALGMVALLLIVGALFPSLGGSIGKLDVPEGVAELLGGADYGSLAGWLRSEMAIYGPLVISAIAITAAAASTAGEEEAGILALVLAHPIERSRLIVEKAGAVAVSVVVVAAGAWIGLLAGVAVAGGGIDVGHLAALALHLACFGLMIGALALALAAATGRSEVAVAGASAFAVLGFLINGFAPLVDGLAWLQYLSPFHYYSGNDPLSRGVDLSDLAILCAATVSLATVAALAFRRRDLRA